MTREEGGFLERMAEASRARTRAAVAHVPLDVVQTRADELGAPVPLRVTPQGFDIIAEVKLRSPSEGALVGSDVDVAERIADQARSYSSAGASAISVLTEPNAFAGDLSHVRIATAATQAPVMRKDFLVDPYQIFEARAAGAAGVLLIARILEDDQIQEMSAIARARGMFVLLECFDRHDIDRVARNWHVLSGDRTHPADAPVLLGVNCRDLSTLQVDFERLVELAPRLPDGAITIAESGLATPEEASVLAAAGYRMALVGSALMQAPNPSDLLQALLAAGRAEVKCASA